MSSWFVSWLGVFSGIITQVGCSALLMHAPAVNCRQPGVSGLPLACVWASAVTALFFFMWSPVLGMSAYSCSLGRSRVLKGNKSREILLRARLGANIAPTSLHCASSSRGLTRYNVWGKRIYLLTRGAAILTL